MKNLKVSVKLVLCFSIVIALAVVVGAVGIYGMDSINNADSDLYNYNVIAISAIGEIRESVVVQRMLMRDCVLNAGDRGAIDNVRLQVTAQEDSVRKLMADYEATITNESAESDYRNAKTIYETTFAQFKNDVYAAAYVSYEDGLAALYNPAISQPSAVMMDGFAASKYNNDQWAHNAIDGNSKLFNTMAVAEIIVLVVAVAVALFLAFYMSGMISKLIVPMSEFFFKAGTTGDIFVTEDDEIVIGKYIQNKDELGRLTAGVVSFIERLSDVSSALESVADGDLTVDLASLSDKDVLGLSLRKMEDNLNDMFRDIRSSTDQVSTGAKQVADGAQTLAQGSTEQAASVQQLSNSISDIANKTKTNADMALKAADLAVTIKESAQKGSMQMDEMMVAVGDINEASQSISKVIKTIDDIAFQTNILALNAAVEAARAGQHGKGFAVVAEEVRNLAAKSAQAAKETGSLIENSIEKATLGVRIAGETASSLTNIVSGINESDQLISEIASASEEQSQGISQINIGIDQVAQVIQQNSATAQESAAASEEMSGQSDVLQQLIARFKLKDGAGSLSGFPATVDAPSPSTFRRPVTFSEYGSNLDDGGSGNFGKY